MSNRKAVVVEAGRGWAIILLPNGAYKRIRTNRYLETGELYQLNDTRGAKYLAAAAIFLIILWGSIDYYTVQAYAEVSSLELGLNRWGRVVSVQAANDEGKRIADTVKVENEPLEVAVENIAQAVKQQKPGRQSIGQPTLKVKAKGKAGRELEQELLEKVHKGMQKNTRIENKEEKKEAKPRSAPIDKPEEIQDNPKKTPDKWDKQEEPKTPGPKAKESEVTSQPGNPVSLNQSRPPEIAEDRPNYKNERADKNQKANPAGKKDIKNKDNSRKMEN